MKKIDYRELIGYGVFGMLTILVNMITYMIFTGWGMDYRLANILSIILTKTFAYITNKIFVFKSKTANLKETLQEMTRFIIARASTGIVDFFGQIALVELLKINDLLSKLIIIVIVTILNYILSKKNVFSRSNKLK